MYYLIGGVSRAGKSTISKLICQEHHLSHLSMDPMMSALIAIDNPLKINYMSDSDLIAKQMWPFTKSWFTSQLQEPIEAIVEGISLWPDLVKEIDNKVQFKACFIGYKEIEPYKKLDQLRNSKDGINPWHQDFTDEALLEQLNNIILISKRLYESCLKSGYPYVESGTSTDLIQLKELVIHHLGLDSV